MSIFSNAENWLSNLISKIVTWAQGAEKIIKPFVETAENVLNALKSFDDSAIGKTVISIIESAIPAADGLINAFINQLPVWLADLKFIDSTLDKTIEEQWQEALAYLNGLDDDTKAVQLNSLKALFLKFFANNNGNAVNIQQALTLSQPTHNIDKVVSEPVGE